LGFAAQTTAVGAKASISVSTSITTGRSAAGAMSELRRKRGSLFDANAKRAHVPMRAKSTLLRGGVA
jgi:hypothetical protein